MASAPASAAGSLQLVIVAGPHDGAFSFAPSQSPIEIGRISSAACRLDDPTVSRRHATLRWSDGRWWIRDAGSRGGTALNGRILTTPAQLNNADEIGIGPWRLQVVQGERGDASTISVTEQDSAGAKLRATPRRLAQPLALQRLTLLLDYAERLQQAESERQLAAELLNAACRGAAFPDGVVLRNPDLQARADLLASAGDAGVVSRSVLREAQRGQVIRLSDSPELVEAQSIMMSGVRDVLCVPIVDAREIWGFLYLVRSHTGATSDADDAADFCVAIGRLAEIALSSLRRRSLEQEIVAARQAQERLMPAVQGTAPGLQYAMVSRPGRGVAGDLLDVVAVDDRRTVALLGDITGKGAGPALLMSAAQAFLNGALRRSTTLLETVEELNAYLVSRSLIGEFLTLWIGLYDADACEIEYVDAGHGFAAMATAAGETSLLQAGGGPPLGLETGSHWTSERRRVEAGDRLLLFSDGLAEQRSPAGKFFGLEAAIELFAQSESPTGVIASLDEAARTHAGPGPFSDDFTIVCIEFDAR